MSEVLYFLYSTNSPACQPLLPVMKKISNYITVHPIDIDLDVSIRKRIETTDIQTVPCLLVHTPDKIMILENEQLDQFIHKLIDMIQQQQQQSAIPPEAQVTSLVNPNELRPPPPPTETSYNANVNSRLNPMEFSGPPMDVQQPQSKSEKSVNFDDMLISGGNESTPSTSGSDGYTIDDIIGTGGGAKSSKAADEKTSKVRSFAETMKQERDEEESKYRKS